MTADLQKTSSLLAHAPEQALKIRSLEARNEELRHEAERLRAYSGEVSDHEWFLSRELSGSLKLLCHHGGTAAELAGWGVRVARTLMVETRTKVPIRKFPAPFR